MSVKITIALDRCWEQSPRCMAEVSTRGGRACGEMGVCDIHEGRGVDGYGVALVPKECVGRYVVATDNTLVGEGRRLVRVLLHVSALMVGPRIVRNTVAVLPPTHG